MDEKEKLNLMLDRLLNEEFKDNLGGINSDNITETDSPFIAQLKSQVNTKYTT